MDTSAAPAAILVEVVEHDDWNGEVVLFSGPLDDVIAANNGPGDVTPQPLPDGLAQAVEAIRSGTRDVGFVVVGGGASRYRMRRIDKPRGIVTCTWPDGVVTVNELVKVTASSWNAVEAVAKGELLWRWIGIERGWSLQANPNGTAAHWLAWRADHAVRGLHTEHHLVQSFATLRPVRVAPIFCPVEV